MNLQLSFQNCSNNSILSYHLLYLGNQVILKCETPANDFYLLYLHFYYNTPKSLSHDMF